MTLAGLILAIITAFGFLIQADHTRDMAQKRGFEDRAQVHAEIAANHAILLHIESELAGRK